MSTGATGSTSSSSQGDFFFGWDLLYKTIESTVNKTPDVLIALAHFVLIKHSKFECIGVGEDKTLSDDEVGSELLPDGWNDETTYALRYRYNQSLYLLLGHKTEDILIINLLDVKTKKVSNIALNPDEVVKKKKGQLKDMLPNASEIVDRYRKELIDPVFSGTTKEVTTQTATASNRPERNDPLRVTEPMRPVGQFMPVGTEPRPFGFPDVGRGDLDPLGRIGSGNLFEFPPQRPPLHGNAQPRFDPFGPPDRNIRPNPNPDHLQPPNFGGHDYYM